MKTKRMISTLLAGILALMLCAPASASGADILTRGKFVSALFAQSGITDMEPKQAWFEDVPTDGELALAVRWAVMEGIITGYGDGRFGPGDPVTREQMAAMLYRYAHTLGQGFQGAWYFPLNYPDASEISGWADEAMHWCVMHGILTGTDRGLEPKGTATDGQLALVLERWRKATEAGASDAVSAAAGSLSREGYVLEQAVVLSRHNIRSPLSGGGSLLGTITPHEWFAWSSNPSELSLRGGVLETEMGQYFRKWLEAEGLFPENYHPDDGAVRVYANAKQRTIATAEYFVSGLLPTAGTPIETHVAYDTMDPVFTPQLTFVSPEYCADAEAQVWELYTDTVNGLADNYELLANVIDMEQSEAWADGSTGPFRTDDSQLVFELNKEPAVKGSLKTACSVSDALVLQSYEEPDPVKAAFGHALTDDEWKEISEVKDVYVDVLFTAPLIAANVAHPLLQEIEAELTADGRVFSFLCGHDSNVGSVLAALGAEDYTLPGAIEAKTPIGCKLVFCRWRGPDGNAYCTVDLVYQTTEQLRGMPLLDLEHHPAIVPMRFAGLTTNADGLYAEQDFLRLLQDSIAEYDRIVEDYAPAAAA